MAKANAETWSCAICSLKTFPYGEPCPTWATDCVNRDRAHITGRWYLGQLLDTSQQLTAVGIAAIADEDQTSSSVRPLKASKHDE